MDFLDFFEPDPRHTAKKEAAAKEAGDVSKPIADADPKADNNLIEKEAKARFAVIADVSYALRLGFDKGADAYDGDCTVTFAYKGEAKGASTFVDFTGDTITALDINGRSVLGEENVWKGHRLHLKSEWLSSKQKNTLRVVYRSKFVKTGNGLFRCADSEDQSEYIYSNFEPFECHRMMPCFDQPDLKAVLSLSIRAPATWPAVLGNGPEVSAKADGDAHTLRVFKDTQPISTYLFVAIAGEYEKFTDNSFGGGRIPMSLYVRKTLKKHFDYEHLFDVTKRAMAWYEKFFDYPYPFDKYDQVFVPELNIGAMEHPGAVTFTDQYVFKDKPSTAVLAKRCDTVVHEMAHMWFGNLVTMKWWDDLWLNESFATYMAALCVSEATDFGSLGWSNFNSVMKRWGMQEDELSTTHPVAGIVPDTDYAETNFDGVTYGKGASLLKQLVCCVGMDGFRAGVRGYFKRYAWGNTVCSDFVNAMADGEKKAAALTSSKLALDPKVWSDQWLATASMNTLMPVVTYSGEGKAATIKSFVVQQTAKPEYPTLRQHTLEVGLFDWNAQTKQPVLREAVRVTVKAQAATELPELAGKPKPDFVFLNYNDHAYAKFPLDPTSYAFVVENIDRFPDAMLRQLLYTEVYYMARDCLIPSTDFLDLIVEKLDAEKEPKIVETFLVRAQIVLARLVPDRLISEHADALFDMCFKRARDAQTKEFHTIWCNSVCAFMYSKLNVETMVNFLGTAGDAKDADAKDVKSADGKPQGTKLGSFPLTQKQRWTVVKHAMAWNLPRRDELLAAEAARDKSDAGAQAVLAVKTSAWDGKVKADAWARYLDPNTTKTMRHHQIGADMSGFAWRHQTDLLHPTYTDAFFATVHEQFGRDQKEFCKNFVSYLLPFRPEDPTVVSRTKQLLDSAKPDELRFIRSIRAELDDLQRAQRCRAMILTNQQPAVSPKRKLTAPVRVDRSGSKAAPSDADVLAPAPGASAGAGAAAPAGATAVASKEAGSFGVSSTTLLLIGGAAAAAAIAGFVYFRSSRK